MTAFRSPIASSAQALAQACRREGAAAPLHCDVLIVGSGYGGAVAAARLGDRLMDGSDGAQRPCVVWLVERGREYLPGDFPSRFAELPGHVRFSRDGGPARGRREGLFDLRLGSDMAALVANGVGGGSLINAGVMAQPDAAVWDNGRWPRALRGDRALEEAMQRVRRMLFGTEEPECWVDGQSEMPPKYAMLRALAPKGWKVLPCAITVQKAAVDANAFDVAMRACTACGDCMTGCNQGAKGSLDTNYLRLARRGGVEIFSGATVRQVSSRGAGVSGWDVDWCYTEPQLRPREAGEDAAMPKIRAGRVILAAGTFGSTEILMRSKAAGLSVSKTLGSRFSGNGDLIALGIGHPWPVHSSGRQEADPFDADARRVGPTITGMIRRDVGKAASDGQPEVEGRATNIVAEELAVPAALRHVLGEIAATLDAGRPSPSATAALLRGQADPLVVTDAMIERLSVFGMMGDDGADGRLVLRESGTSVDGAVTVDWCAARNGKAPLPQMQFAWLVAAMKRYMSEVWAEVGGSRGAGEVLSAGAGTGVLGHFGLLGEAAFTVHPLGGCPMADTAEEGVVDACGRVFDASDGKARDDLVVLDGSIVPCALGVNPALTIAALAEHAMPQLLEAWKISEAPAGKPEPRVMSGVALPPAFRRELPPPYAAWRLSERLQGWCPWAGHDPLWAELDLVFEPIPGFRRTLALERREAQVERAVLHLWRLPKGGDGRALRRASDVALFRASLSGTVTLFEPLPGGAVGLSYHLTVQSVVQGVGEPLPLAVQSRLHALKTIGPKQSGIQRGIFRQLTEAEVKIDSESIGRWALDMNQLADRGEVLLQLGALSSMPDALDDLGALGLYLLRSMRPWMHLANEFSAPPLPAACMRRPQDIEGFERQHFKTDVGGAWLTRYRPLGSDKVPAERNPVLLIHGLGMSGNTFTLPGVDDRRCIVEKLFAEGFDPWVLDVRSSIGNDAGRALPASADWTVDQVGCEDVAWALDIVQRERNGAKIDVLAHCMGAVMFCIAALRSDVIMKQVGAVVLSQVGPLARLHPLNRLRGLLAAYAQRYLHVDELDPHAQDSRAMQHLGDWLMASLPYDDDELQRQAKPDESMDVKRWKQLCVLRRRADAMFGQLFQSENMGGDTLQVLDRLLGWVKVPMLAQALHFARLNMLTDAEGMNSFLTADSLRQRFGFPLLIVHGVRSGVFDWRGSFQSLVMVRRARGLRELEGDWQAALQAAWDSQSVQHRLGDDDASLVLMPRHGHLDSLIGKESMVPEAIKFLKTHHARRDPPAAPAVDAATSEVQNDIEEPWVGPVLGWTHCDPAAQQELLVRLLLGASPRRADVARVAVVPLLRDLERLVPRIERTRLVAWPAFAQGGGAGELRLHLPSLENSDGFAVLLVHDDMGLGPELGLSRSMGPQIEGDGLSTGRGAGTLLRDQFELVMDKTDLFLGALDRPRDEWLIGSEPASDGLQTRLREFLEDGGTQRLARCSFHLAAPVLRLAASACILTPRQAAGKGGAAMTPVAQPLRFLAASCQYPAGMLDGAAADASYQAMAACLRGDAPPQVGFLLGDQVYVDETAGVFDPQGRLSSASRARDLRALYERSWRMPGLRFVAGRLPLMTLMDDHEVMDNWQPGSSDGEHEAYTAFRRFQQALNPPAADGDDRLSYMIRLGGACFFALDSRSRREPRLADDTDAPNYVGKARILDPVQMQALKDGLKEAPAGLAKIVLSASPLLPPERFDDVASRLRSDTWAGYPASLVDLLAFIQTERISKVVFLSGDSHLSSVSEFCLDGCKVLSVVSSGSYTPWPFANQTPKELKLEGKVSLPAEGVEGAVTGNVNLRALTTHWSFAVLGLEASDDGAAHTALTVELLSPQADPVRCRCSFD